MRTPPPPGGGTVRVTGITLDKTSLTLTEDESAQLTAAVQPANASNKTVVWASSDPSVAEVDGEGKVTARAPGAAVITATTRDGGFAASCTVMVTGKRCAVTYDPNGGSGSMPAGSAVSRAVLVLPENLFQREGYTFIGWGYDGEIYEAGAAFTMLGHAVTVATQWEAIVDGVTGIVIQNGAGVSGTTVRLMQGGTEIARYVTGPGGRFSLTDADKASGYALDALRWAAEAGILNGYGDGRLNSEGLAARAQVAQMLKNFIENQEENT